ncbi:MAG: F0F1 ATP synthase subunit A [Anaerolineaceae bacterium]|nr:F0F1 ATP synthase subunit A [Anaerolineaceae bacterium]
MDELTPTVVFTIFGIPVTNTVTSTWMIIAILAFIAWILGKRAPYALEMVVDFLSDSLEAVMGIDPMPFLPFLMTIFMFIAGANLFGVVPFIANPARDINTPIALALMVFFSVYYYGIRTKGLIGYLKGLADPIILLPFELIGHFTRTLSLTLRLFGNVISIELIVVILLALIPLFVPVILEVYGMMTGLIQAYIFSVLASVYIAAGVEAGEPIEKLEELPA